MSEVAQVYGALSILLSTMALAGVALSLVLQARQTQAAQEEATWTSLRELVCRAIDDPSLAVCWAPPVVTVTREEWRQLAYINLIVTGWDKAFRLERITPEQLHVVAQRHFKGEMARRHWDVAGEDWVRIAGSAKSRRTRQFPLIVEAEYRKAVEHGPAIPPSHYFSADE
ncbi:DUF6082 family protein [Streptomyces buecherae]|uniref:DUF6082 family protein n=1 Tax=Streptomyces buecherae TaxID=2763006 RepID=UPI003648156D